MRRNESGQGIVEFALVLPWLCALAFLLISLGKVIYFSIYYIHLSNEGARFAAVNRPGSLQAYLCSKAGSDPSLKNITASVTFPGTGSNPQDVGQPVHVTVKGDYHLMGLTLSVGGSSTMRLEQPVTYTAGAVAC